MFDTVTLSLFLSHTYSRSVPHIRVCFPPSHYCPKTVSVYSHFLSHITHLRDKFLHSARDGLCPTVSVSSTLYTIACVCGRESAREDEREGERMSVSPAF